MKLIIEIDLDNDAFAGSRRAGEIRRILDGITDKLFQLHRHQLPSYDQTLMDINGNGVGRAVVDDKKDPATRWEDNYLQFPRFAAEALGVLTEAQHRQLRESMDLRRSEMENLTDRIEIEWERVKSAQPMRRVTPGGELLDYAVAALSGERKCDDG